LTRASLSNLWPRSWGYGDFIKGEPEKIKKKIPNQSHIELWNVKKKVNKKTQCKTK